MVYSLIMALIMLALGIVSFWGRNQGIFGGIYATAPLTSVKTNWTDKKDKAVDLTELKPDKQGTLTIYYRLPKKLDKQDKLIFFSRYIKQIDAYIGKKKIYHSHPEIAADWLSTMRVLPTALSCRQNGPLNLEGLLPACWQAYRLQPGQ